MWRVAKWRAGEIYRGENGRLAPFWPYNERTARAATDIMRAQDAACFAERAIRRSELCVIKNKRGRGARGALALLASLSLPHQNGVTLPRNQGGGAQISVDALAPVAR